MSQIFRHGSNKLDSSSSTERSSPVMLSPAKHLAADQDRPYAEFTLSAANGLRVTRCDCSSCHGLFFKVEPCLRNLWLISTVNFNDRTVPKGRKKTGPLYEATVFYLRYSKGR